MSARHSNLTSSDGRHDDQSTREDRLVAAMEQYRAAIDAGQSIDRQAFLGQYPDMAPELAECLAAMEIIQGVAKQVSQADFAPSASESPAPQTLHALGDFQIVRELGRGGMGVVYEAQQLSLGRTVALKVLPFAAMLDDKQLQRFKNEARAAATLNHPNIVPVHFVGTERGVHFYAMQLIEGHSLAEIIAATMSGNGEEQPETATPNRAAETEPIASLSTEYSANPKRYYRTVAEIGAEIAEALGHAHQHGIIHRDVKPGNILVDKQGKPWITDFGLARAEGDTSISLSGDLLGTLRYMSPEQASGARHLVDDRADVYSLGATLYELATLRPVIDGASRADLLAKITSEDATAPRRITASIPAELETIVLKAIAKDPDERYGSAQEMADDLRRHLQDLPIHARRPTLLQRIIKKSRRHRTVVAFAGVLLAVIAVGSMVSTALLWAERRETNRALATAEEERTTAKQKAAEAKAITDFLVKDLLGSVDPKKAKGRNVTVDEVLANAEAKIGTAFKDEPLTEAAVRHTLASVLIGLGRYADAKAHAVRARDLRIAHLGAEHADTLKSTLLLAFLLRDQGDLSEARKLNEQVFEASQRIHGPDHEFTLGTMSDLAIVLERQGELEQSRQLNRQVLDARQRILGPDHEATLASMQNLAVVLTKQRRPEEARKLYEQALETMRRTLGPDHPYTCTAMHNLATILQGQDEFDRARKLYEQVLDVRRRVLGPDHPETLVTMYNLFRQFYFRERKLAEARILGESLLEAQRRVLGPGHPNTLITMTNLGCVLKDLGDLEKARQLGEQTMEAQRRLLGEDHPYTLGSMYNLAAVLSEQGELDEACKLHEQVLKARRRVLGPDHEATIASMTNLAIVLWKQRKLEQARKLFEESLEAHRRVHGPDHPGTCTAMRNLGSVFLQENQLDRARELFEQAIEVQRRILGPDHPDTLGPRESLVQLLLQEGKQDAAQEQCKPLLEAYRRILGPDHPDTTRMMHNLAKLLYDQGEFAEAGKIKQQLVETRWRISGPCSLATFAEVGDLIEIRTMQNGTAEVPGFTAQTNHSMERAKEISPNIFFMATAHWHLGDKEEAVRWYNKAVDWMDKHKPNDKDLARFRAEAAKLIGS